MCISSSTVFYGIVVRLWSLVRAAKAHATLASSLLALDLIALRQRKGTLQTTHGGAENLPSEVWEMIRRELYSVALDGALANWLTEMRCYGRGARGGRGRGELQRLDPFPFTPEGNGLNQSAKIAPRSSPTRFTKCSTDWVTRTNRASSPSSAPMASASPPSTPPSLAAATRSPTRSARLGSLSLVPASRMPTPQLRQILTATVSSTPPPTPSSRPPSSPSPTASPAAPATLSPPSSATTTSKSIPTPRLFFRPLRNLLDRRTMLRGRPPGWRAGLEALDVDATVLVALA